MTYTEPAPETYVLKRGFNASTRLAAQFYLWKDLLQYNIHPSIPLAHDARIADVATGSGIWLLDMAASLPPTVQCHGFDISIDQCPPAAWLPKNVKIQTWDIFTDPPERFLEYFDVVHVRLITLVIKNNDPRQVISNLRKLLKPGGYLQWDETDTAQSYIKTVDDFVATSAVDRVRRGLADPGNARGLDNWKYEMPKILNQNGFQDSEVFRHEYSHIMARYWSDMYTATWEEFASTVLKTPEETSRLGTEAMEEVRSGSAIVFPKLIWVARKAFSKEWTRL
ncbi:hypothetical protein MMC34_005138 [Xylographa carneopallida]|nr:hypothetical protein [Xylographa carneopallida]